MAARKRRANRARPNGSPESPYPADTPIEESTGMPKTSANISEETARRIGFDPTSARKRKKYKDVLEARAGGVKNVKWDADPQLKYAQMFSVHPDAKVTVKQIAPHVDEALDDQFVKVLPDYGALRKYIKENHWRGDKATYLFKFASASHPVIGEGEVYFNEDPEWAERKEEEMARRQQQANPQYGPQQPPQAQGGYPPPGYGGYPPPGYGYPPQGYAYPPPGYAPQPQTTVVMPQPIQQQAPMPQAPPPNAGNDVFLQYLIAQVEWSRQEIARLQTLAQQPQVQQSQAGAHDWLAWHNAERQRWEAEQAAKLAAMPKAETPAAPQSPLDQMKSTVEMIKAVTSARDSIMGPVKDDAISKAKDDDDGFPVLVKKVGPINIIADKKSGHIIQDMALNTMFNAGNIEDVVKKLGDRAEKFFKDRTQDNEVATAKQLEIEKVKLEQIREKKAANAEAVNHELRIAEARRHALGPAPAPQPIPQAIQMTQAHAEKVASGPIVEADVVSHTPAPRPAPPPWVVGRANLPDPPKPAQTSPPEPEQVVEEVAPVEKIEEEEVEEAVLDTEPPPAPAEPATEPSELRTN